MIIFYTVYIHFHASREKATISYFKEKHSNKSAECIQIVAKEEFYNKQQTVILFSAYIHFMMRRKVPKNHVFNLSLSIT